MQSKLFIYLILSIVLIGGVSAFDSHMLDRPYDLVVSSNNATLCNFSYFRYDNGTKITYDLAMAKNIKDFDITVLGTNFTLQGTNCMGITCFDGGITYETGSKCLDITYNGNSLNSGSSFLYLGLLGVMILFFILDLILIPKLPRDRVDDKNLIVEVTALKYLKPVMLGLAWALLVGILFITANISIAYLPDTMLGQVLFAIYQFMFVLTLPMFILAFIFIFVRFMKDREIKKLIERGVEVPGQERI